MGTDGRALGNDPKAPNPYNETEQSKYLSQKYIFQTITDLVSATTMQDVRLELAWEEALQLASGHLHRHKVTMTGFFSMGFDIEDRQ